MKTMIPLVALVLSGCCQTMQVRRDFPRVPEELLRPVPSLAETPTNATSEKVFEVVIENYGAYHQLSDKYVKWQQWYEAQRKIHDEADKH